MGNNNEELNKLKFIYQEVSESSKIQQSVIDNVNQKFNWIIVSDIGILVLIFSRNNLKNDWLIATSFSLLVSLIFSIISLWTRRYKRGVALIVLNDSIGHSEEKIIEGVNRKMTEAINLNQKTINELNIFLKISIIFLVLAIIFSFLSILIIK